ncbi:MAG: UDP-N-acetylmuramate dehydrogenase [Candidatus Pacebacteria bacterium]|nr:UDP-N-acetylmuramate dehydrogenase [Candidatus Paceibacterota bacterium]
MAKNHLNGFLPMDIQNKLKNNISLKELTTFRIGGETKYLLEAKNREEIIEAVKLAQKKRVPFFVLGTGSNTLVNDKKYKGLVIKIQDTRYKIQNTIIEVEAGVALGKIVGLAFQNSLAGMEWAIGIPGTVGGAVYGNAGAFGKSMGDVVEEVEAIDTENFKFQISNFKNKECRFEYRNSIFKKNKNLIILSVKIKLQPGNKTEIEKKMKDFFQIKKQTQPLEYFSAGSVFKNPEGFSAGKLVEQSGLKGKRIGKAQISNKHSNFIVNMDNAKAKDVKKLVNLVKKTVKKKFNIDLEEEIQYLNF